MDSAHETLLGVGTRKKAYLEPEAVRVVFNERLTNEQIKSVYALDKIAQTLFPGIIPSIKGAGNTTENTSEYVVEGVPHDELHQRIQQLEIKRSSQTADAEDLKLLERLAYEADRRLDRPDVQSFIQQMDGAGFRHQDTTAGLNYIFSENDKQFWYVDKSPGWLHGESPDNEPRFIMHFDPGVLNETIERINDPEKRSSAKGYFENLMTLASRAGITSGNMIV